MADVRKIVVEIRAKGENQSTIADNTQKNDTPKENNTNKESLLLAKSVLLNQAVNTAKRLTISAVNNNINRYLTLTEDYLAQDTYHNALNTINKSVTLAGSLYAGAKLGAVGGVAGSVIGMGIATVGFVGSNLINYQATMSGYYRQINASNIERAYGSKRAGLIDGGKGTDN